MKGTVTLIRNFKEDTPIDVSDVIGVVFVSETGNRIEVDMRADGRIVVEADEMQIHPHSADQIDIESRKVKGAQG
jgi:hypothetical protein